MIAIKETMDQIITSLCSYSSDIISGCVTLLAAFAGAWFAFKFQHNYEEKRIVNNNILLLNMTFLKLFHQLNDLLSIQKNFIAPINDDQMNWISIPALSFQNKLINPDISSISFLINNKKHDVISEILIAIEKYEVCIDTINRRSEVHLKLLQPTIEKISIQYSSIDIVDIQRELGIRISTDLINMTKEILDMLPETINYYKTVLDKLTKYGDEIFQKGKIFSFKLFDNK